MPTNEEQGELFKSLTQYFTGSILKKYPDLVTFLQSSPPDPTLLNAPLDQKYHLKDATLRKRHTDVFSLCCLLGKIAHCQALLSSQTDKQKRAVIKRDDYLAFRFAARKGHTDTVRYLVSLAPDKVRDMVAAKDFEVLCLALSKGYSDTLQYLFLLVPIEVRAIALAYISHSFFLAADSGHTDTLKCFESFMPDDSVQYVLAKNFAPFRGAAGSGYTDTLRYLVSLAPDKVSDMVAAKDFAPLYGAAGSGYTDTLRYLVSLAPDKARDMVAAGDFKAFRAAAESGHKHTLEFLTLLVPDKVIKSMVVAKDFRPFGRAALRGHTNILKYLVSLVPDDIVQLMVAVSNFKAFTFASRKGHTDTLRYLVSLAPDKVSDMVAAENFAPFCSAAGSGDTDTLRYLVSLAPDKARDMVAAGDFKAFRAAAESGHKHTLEFLTLLVPDKVIKPMVVAKDFKAFSRAAYRGHTDILKYLVSLAPDKVSDMVAAMDFAPFRMAAGSGYIETLRYLVSLAPDKMDAMVEARDFDGFHTGVGCARAKIIVYMLRLDTPSLIAHVESHVYGNYFINYLNQKIALWRAQQASYESAHPTGIFDVDERASKVGFYFLRRLIRIPNESRIEEIQFLLSIPGIAQLAAAEVTAGRPNELLRLAMSVPHEAAANLLLSIPAVRELAAQHDFYREEQQYGLDIAQLARDHESSMRALTSDEQQRLDKLQQHYQPTIAFLGLDNAFTALKETLRERFEANPATIVYAEGKVIELPFEYDAFEALSLNNQENQQALNAYYEHQDHTVYRYLSRPNPWMAPDAPYVLGKPAERQGYSTFEQYKVLITLLWLAAFDDDTPAMGGHTLEGRKNHFIKELALIGRAHNYDNDEIEKTLCNGETVKGEYDDGEGDKPTCYSGVKRRLFQSVIGHPLIDIFHKDILALEIKNFVRAYYQVNLKKEDACELLDIVNVLEEDPEALTNAQNQRLISLNIPQDNVTAFIEAMKAKYPALSSSTTYFYYLTDKFTLRSPDESHIMKLFYVADMLSLLKKIADNSSARKSKGKGKKNKNAFFKKSVQPAAPATTKSMVVSKVQAHINSQYQPNRDSPISTNTVNSQVAILDQYIELVQCNRLEELEQACSRMLSLKKYDTDFCEVLGLLKRYAAEHKHEYSEENSQPIILAAASSL